MLSDFVYILQFRNVVRYVHSSQACEKASMGFHFCSGKTCFINEHIYWFFKGIALFVIFSKEL